MPCKYADILGKPGEGVHSKRFLGFAINDVLSTFLLALIINYLIEGNWASYGIVLVFCFSLGVILHKIFCVNTTFNKMIFGII